MEQRLKEIGEQFRILGDFVTYNPNGKGHINDTFVVSYDQGGTIDRYTFQRINHEIFKNPPGVMENINRVSAHLQHKLKNSGHASRKALSLVHTHDDASYLRTEDGNYWRVYIYVEGAASVDVIDSPEQAYEAAKAFGEFQENLLDLPGGRLLETIPDFHNTPKRFRDFVEAVEKDRCDRAKIAKAEIDFVMSRKPVTEILLDLHEEGKIPERVCHNDTKINNVLFDDVTNEGVCVIDLDTVMPGLALYDFGDLVRTCASPAVEDERDLSKVTMRMPIFESLVEGYLKSAGHFLTPAEVANLAFSGKLITLEIGMRFLTDFLVGDNYFKTSRVNHNLDRSRTQFELVKSIEDQEAAMVRFVESRS